MVDRTALPMQSVIRLSRADRRRQLLDVAKTLLERRGARDLTLAILAEEAGVSKPIAYDHFGSRSGLWVAMLEDIGRYYTADAEVRIAHAPKTIPAIAEIVATAYVQCAIAAGPAMTTLAAAIEADPDAQEVGRARHSDHALSFQRAFAATIDVEAAQLLLFRGLVAAANAICDDCVQGRTASDKAIATLTHLLVTSLSPFERTQTHKRSAP